MQQARNFVRIKPYGSVWYFKCLQTYLGAKQDKLYELTRSRILGGHREKPFSHDSSEVRPGDELLSNVAALGERDRV